MRRLALGLVLGVLATSGSAPPALAAEHDAVARVTEGAFLLDGSEVPPPASQPGWARVALPDAWRRVRPAAGGVGWYRFELPGVAARAETWALHLPQVNMNAEAWLNGTRVGTGGRFSEPVAHNFNRPLFFVFPGELLDGQRNVLHVRLFAYPHHYGGLGPVELGPEQALRATWEWRHLVQVELARLGTVIACATSAIFAMLWLGTRRDAVYGTFALATAFWAVTSFNYWVRDIPLSHWSWERVMHLSLAWFAVLLAIWSHRLSDLRRPRLERALLAFAAVASGLTLTLPIARFYHVMNPLHLVSLGVGGYAAVRALRSRRGAARWELAVYLVAGACALVFASHDIGVQLGWVDADGPFLLPLVAPLMLVSFGSSLMARFVRSLEQVRQQHLVAETLVREKAGELERNHERLRSLERERAVANERERIMREMHDGLGAQLVAALAMVESDAAQRAGVAQALRGALAEMRAVIDSLDPGLSDLGALLGIFRSRIDPLLESRAVRLHWRVGELPKEPPLGAEPSLHLLRILQEAVINAVTHGGAGEIALETRWEHGHVRVAVRDDGCGFDVDAAREGRGLRNMRHRASLLGGGLGVESAAGEGTRVELRLPARTPDPLSREP